MFYELGDNKRKHFSYKEELQQEKERLERREAYMKNIKKGERIIRPHDFYTSGNTIIDEQVEIDAGFANHK